MSSHRALPFFFILTLILSLPSIAKALPAEVTLNLRQIEGVIVMPIDGQYLIDLDASKGITEGDLFSVIIPGPEVVHPVTGKVIGSLDKVAGWLEVTDTKNGYSYARPLNPADHFTKKTKIQRFTHLPATFWDYDGNGEKVFAELHAALPQLEWHTYLADQAQRPAKPGTVATKSPALTFILTGGQLQIRGLNARLIGQYALTAAVALQPTRPTLQRPANASPAIIAVAPASNTAIIKNVVQKPAGAIIHNQSQDSAGIWSSTTLAGNPVGLEVADFDGDGLNEVAILNKTSLEIGRFNGREYQKIQTLPLDRIEKALTISSADLDGDGQPELFISAMDGLEVASLVVSITNGSYRIAQGNLQWFLRAIQNPDGSKTVLGQAFGNKVDVFDQKIEKIEFHNGRYASASEYPHPWQTKIFSLQPLTDAEGKTGYAEIAANDQLRFFSADNEILWESSDSYGGGVVSIPRDDRTGGADSAKTFIYLKPRMALLDSTTLLAPRNEGWRISKSFQSGPGQVSALRWDGSSMVELWHTKPQQGTLVDFQYADIDNDHAPELALLFHYKRAGLLSKGKAGLKIFEIN